MNQTVFRTYSRDVFIANEAWADVESLLKGNGGCFGLHGPRGSGKSWAMLRACDEARQTDGIGLWFPAPREYESTEFLTSLADNFASAVEQKLVLYSSRRKISSTVARIAAWGLGADAAIALILYLTDSTNIQRLIPWGIVGASLAYVGLSAWLPTLMVGRTGASTERGEVVSRATLLRERIRYSAQLKTAAEGGGGSSILSMKLSKERSLAERPTTISSLVTDFRALAEKTAQYVSGRVVIAIDELDKIEDSARVRQLLRDIKAIFEIAGVYFFVSVSSEATASLELGSSARDPSGRNEFNSSLYTVIEVPRVTPRRAAEVLVARVGDLDPASPAITFVAVLSGGNQREMVRLANEAFSGVFADISGLTSQFVFRQIEAVFKEVAASGGLRSGAAELEFERSMDAIRSAAASEDLAKTVLDEAMAIWEEELWIGDEAVQQSCNFMLRRFHIRLLAAGLLASVEADLTDDNWLLGVQTIVANGTAYPNYAGLVLRQNGQIIRRVMPGAQF